MMTASVTRLHISPLTPGLLPAILGPTVCQFATNVSYHSIETFPENNYGYVDLPAVEAEKIKKKLNGAIMKGKKIKVEEARPKKRKHQDDESEVSEPERPLSETTPVTKKKPKKERDVLPGHELDADRKVKRGWTESKSDKSKKKKDKSKSKEKPQATSKYTEKEELLFKTKTPKNRSATSENDAKRKRKERNGVEVVHEFERSTTIPSFLRSTNPNGTEAVEYRDNEGWVDDQGKVVEGETPRTTRRRKAAQVGIEAELQESQSSKSQRKQSSTVVVPKLLIEATESGSTTPDQSSSSEEDRRRKSESANIEADDETSSSGDSDLDSASGSDSETSPVSSVIDTRENDTLATNTTPSKPKLHPLEALFKKPTKPASSQPAANSQDVAKPSLEVQTSFSFFEQQEENNNSNLPPMPMTPFSSQDLRTREIRSAAPTPDTAHPSRMGSIFNGEESEGELSELDDTGRDHMMIVHDQQTSSGSQHLDVPQTDFEKRFWENRGDNNRSWKARRRAVLKEKRQRDNRARRPKNW